MSSQLPDITAQQQGFFQQACGLGDGDEVDDVWVRNVIWMLGNDLGGRWEESERENAFSVVFKGEAGVGEPGELKSVRIADDGANLNASNKGTNS